MAKPAGNCPNCGAPVEFQFSSAVQTTCPYCNSILVRHDVDLEKVGVVADLPPDVSPIQLLTEGIYRDLSFQVVGRIVYEYELGSWNEWHCMTHKGGSIWLSDAMAQYAITQEAAPRPSNVPPAGKMWPGAVFTHAGIKYEVTGVTKARYRGVQGELPFEYWDKDECTFVDLRTPDARFATIDYTEEPPIVFVGEMVDFDSLRLKNLKEFEGW